MDACARTARRLTDVSACPAPLRTTRVSFSCSFRVSLSLSFARATVHVVNDHLPSRVYTHLALVLSLVLSDRLRFLSKQRVRGSRSRSIPLLFLSLSLYLFSLSSVSFSLVGGQRDTLERNTRYIIRFAIRGGRRSFSFS